MCGNVRRWPAPIAVVGALLMASIVLEPAVPPPATAGGESRLAAQSEPPFPAPSAGLRVPPWRPPTRAGAAPTPVALGVAPEVAADAGQAVASRARAAGSQLAVDLDSPADGSVAAGYTPVVGWAADLRPGGAGVDADNVQVWLGGAEGTPLGVAQYGWERPDLVPLVGDARRARAGFRLGWQTCGFPPGAYQVVAYGWRQGTAEFGLASANVTVRPCAAEPGTVLFADPLDGANPWGRDWSTGGSDACTLRYVRDEYRVLKLDGAQVTACAAPDVERTVYGDLVLDLDVRVVEASPGAYAVVGVRQDIAQFSARLLAGYAVHLRPNEGTIALVHDLGGSHTPLAETRPAGLRRGDAANHLTVVAEGPALRVYVNGSQALAVHDERSPWGAITLGAGAPSGVSAEAAFQNLVVRRP